MPNETEKIVAGNLKNRLKKTLYHIKKCEAFLQEGVEQSAYLEDVLRDSQHGTHTSNNEINEIQSSISQSMLGLRGHFFRAYWTLSEPENFDEALSKPDALHSDFQQKIAPNFEVKAAVRDNILLIKLPLLWSRYWYKRSGNSPVKSSDYLEWFDRELDSALYQIEEKLPLFLERNFTYLHVTPAGKYATDSDNYDTKHVTDVIANHLVGTDHPSYNSFFYASMQEGLLSPGTYVAITQGVRIVPQMDKIISLIMSEF